MKHCHHYPSHPPYMRQIYYEHIDGGGGAINCCETHLYDTKRYLEATGNICHIACKYCDGEGGCDKCVNGEESIFWWVRELKKLHPELLKQILEEIHWQEEI